MDSNKTTLERAFDLAQSGKCTDLTDVMRHLKAEGYNQNQIEGRRLKQQLTTLIRNSHAAA
jgi:hypothetical protein